MKKKLIPLFLLISFTLVKAQESNISFGVKGGLNIAKLVGNNSENKSILGFHIGTVLEIPISSTFAFQPELTFSTQGSKESGFLDYTKNLHYVDLSIVAKYYLAKGFSIQTGPYIGFLTSAKGEKKGSIPFPFAFSTFRIDSEENIQDVNPVDFGLNFGIGYQCKSGLFFDTRYKLGLSNLSYLFDERNSIIGINGIDITDGSSLKNTVFQISLGYKF